MSTKIDSSSTEASQDIAFQLASTTPAHPPGQSPTTAEIWQTLFSPQKPDKLNGLEGAGFMGGALPAIVLSTEALQHKKLQLAPGVSLSYLSFVHVAIDTWQNLFASQELDKLDRQGGGGSNGGKSPAVVTKEHRDKLRNQILMESARRAKAENKAAERKAELIRADNLGEMQYDKASVKMWRNEPKPERVVLLESLQQYIHLLCFSNVFLDTIAPWEPCWDTERPGLRHFYDAIKNDNYVQDMVLVKNDKQIPDAVSIKKDEDNGLLNKALRWRIMAWMWNTIHDQILYPKRRLQKYALAYTTIKHIHHFLQIFIDPEVDEFQFSKCLWTMVTQADRLRTVLTSETAVQYRFLMPQNINPRTMHGSTIYPWKTAMEVLSVLGATHDDASQDVIRMVVFGPMVRCGMEEGRCYIQIEKTACVVAYRPEQTEEQKERRLARKRRNRE
ncbi:hypothetical protein G7Z17_g6569 [Cylindrodendrum hubeiense]|uniref:Uncharacterized protein n=1 Tax=Cylindrodendrum hubeiense TaxID=595255 RepID=A0A9P5H9Y6_9HYPO|nr:hypothetical protein G7Z17_g6569 [Cylindrodendrum hubeiense]